MKVGSIVECVDNECGLLQPVPLPKLKQPYTISWIGKGDEMYCDGELTGKSEIAIELAEIDSGEYVYSAKCFRELLPPMEIQEALDSCEPVLIEINKDEYKHDAIPYLMPNKK